MADRDLRDLGEPAEVACRRSRHRVSVARYASRRLRPPRAPKGPHRARPPGADGGDESDKRLHRPGRLVPPSPTTAPPKQVGEPLDAEVARPPFREELLVERVQPLELEEPVETTQHMACDTLPPPAVGLHQIGEHAEVERQLRDAVLPSPTRASRRSGTPSARSACPGGVASSRASSRPRPATARGGGSRRRGRLRPRQRRQACPANTARPSPSRSRAPAGCRAMRARPRRSRRADARRPPRPAAPVLGSRPSRGRVTDWRTLRMGRPSSENSCGRKTASSPSLIARRPSRR